MFDIFRKTINICIWCQIDPVANLIVFKRTIEVIRHILIHDWILYESNYKWWLSSKSKKSFLSTSILSIIYYIPSLCLINTPITLMLMPCLTSQGNIQYSLLFVDSSYFKLHMKPKSYRSLLWWMKPTTATSNLLLL